MSVAKFFALGVVLAASTTAVHADETVTSTAQYSVPVPTDLMIYAQFSIKNVKQSKEGNHVSFIYDLPTELVGPAPLTVALFGTIVPGSPLTLEGERGTGTCILSVDHQGAVCKIQYRNLNIDPSAVETYLKANVKDAAQLAGRLDVSARFIHEPVGIVSYPLTASPNP